MSTDLEFLEQVQLLIDSNKFVNYPYFVLSTKNFLHDRVVHLLSVQLAKTHRLICSAFCSALPRSSSKSKAVQKFNAAAPPPHLCGGTSLFFVTSEPDPSTCILRLSAQSVRAFVQACSILKLPHKKITEGFELALKTVPLCLANYLDFNFNFPTLPQLVALRRNMAHEPNLTISPSLPEFTGGPDEDVKIFTDRLWRVFDCYPNMTATQKVLLLENQCKKEALALIHREYQYLADNPLPNNEQRSAAQILEHLKNSLRTGFAQNTDHDHYRDLLRTRIKNDSETFQQYAQSVLSLCRKARIVEESEIINEVHKGLPLHLVTSINPEDSLTVNDFLNKVQKLYKAHKASVRAHSLKALESFGSPFISNALPGHLPVPAPADLTSPSIKTEPATAAAAHAPRVSVPAVAVKTEPPSTNASVAFIDTLVSKLTALVDPPKPKPPTPEEASVIALDNIISKLANMVQPVGVNAVSADPRPSHSRDASAERRYPTRSDYDDSARHYDRPRSPYPSASRYETERYDPNYDSRRYQNQNYNNYNQQNNSRNYDTRRNDGGRRFDDHRRGMQYNQQWNGPPRHNNNNYNRGNQNRPDYNRQQNNRDFQTRSGDRSRPQDVRYQNNFGNNNSNNSYGRKTAASNPSYRVRQAPENYSVPELSRRNDSVDVCEFCSGDHKLFSCPVRQSIHGPKN